MKQTMVVLAFVNLILISNLCGADYVITKISQGTTGNHHVHINNNSEAVWSGSDGTYQQVYYWNGTTITKIDVNSDNGYFTYPTISDDGDIAWDSRHGSIYEIEYYNASTHVVQTLVSSNINKSNPCLDLNDNVAWYGYNNNDFQLNYRTSDGTISQLANGQHPETNNQGDLVWWGSSSGIYYRDVTTGLITTISSSGQFPDINNNNEIAWTDNGDILVYDKTTGFTVNITEAELSYENNRYPNLNNNGDIVWIGESSLYFYEKATGLIEKIADNISWYSQPQINDSGDIAWRGTDDEIYIASRSNTVPEPITMILILISICGMLIKRRK